MIKCYLIAIAIFVFVVSILVLVVWIQSKVHKIKIEEAKADLMKKQNEVARKTEERINEANRKKGSIRSGDSASDFNASLDVLKKYSEKK